MLLLNYFNKVLESDSQMNLVVELVASGVETENATESAITG
jgi:hypothetical protein